MKRLVWLTDIHLNILNPPALSDDDLFFPSTTTTQELDAGKFEVVVLMSEKWRGDDNNRKELLQMVQEGKGLVVIHMVYVP